MPPTALLLHLQQLLAPECVSIVFKSLLSDPLLRAGLQEESFWKKFAAAAGDRPSSWNPASLALAALGGEESAETLAALAMPAPGQALRQRSLRAYEETLRTNKGPASIEEAGLLALALRERRRLTQSWKGLASEILSARPLEPAATLEIWRTPLACLFGMVPDPEEMLEALLAQREGRPAFALAGHVLLANPLQPEERQAIFARLLRRLGLAEQLSWLLELQGRGEAQLAAQLAGLLLEAGSQGEAKAQPVDFLHADPDEVLQYARTLEQLAQLHTLSGQEQQGLEVLFSAREAARYWLAALNARLADLAARQDRPELAFASIDSIDLANLSTTLPESVQLTLGKHLHAKALFEAMPAGDLHPLVRIAQAGIAAHQGNGAAARDMAREAIARLRRHKQAGRELLPPARLADWRPEETVQTLFDLGLFQEAASFAGWALESRPADGGLLERACEALQQLEDLPKAIEYAQAVLALEPSEIRHHRRLAGLWAATGAWDQAFAEHEWVLQATPEAGEEDWLAYAGSAIESGRFQQAADACEKLLKQDPNHGAANASMGRALAGLSRLDEAIQYLSRATLLIPEEALPWLALSRVYEQNGDPQRSLETLRAGVLSAPESPEVNYALAEACLAAGSLSEALPFLKAAAGLIPESLQVTQQLGRTLYSLGHLAEARQALAKARQKWPTDPDLAYAYADVLLAFGERDQAIPALEVALRKTPPVLERYVRYAETLIGDWRQLLTGSSPADFGCLVNAQQALEKALALSPEDFRALLLLAEVLGAKGRPDEALKIYRGLVEAAESEAPEWRWRVQGGFGKAALSLGEIETALAALQEATQAQPDNNFFQQLLAQAYFAADLPQEALQVARYALRMAPDDLDTLTWFAGMAVELGEEYEAVDALQCATQLAPERPDHWLRLSGLLLQLGDLPAARSALESLLGLENAATGHLRQAAYAYMRMQDPISALGCLKRALSRSKAPEAGLLFEVARLTLQTGDPDGALETIQAAIEHTPEDVSLRVFQSDLLRVLSRPQAALACLECALRLKEAEEEGRDGEAKTQTSPPLFWMDAWSSLPGIHARLAFLLRELGNFPSALYHAQAALALQPAETTFQWLAASLFEGMLEQAEAARLLETPLEDELNGPIFEGHFSQQETEARVALNRLRAAHALAEGKDERALAYLSQGLLEAPEDPHLLLLQARVFARQGDAQVAERFFERAVNLIRGAVAGDTACKTSYDLSAEYVRERELWLAQAALDLQRWEDAVCYSERAIENDPFNPRAFLERARILALCAERQHLCSTLKCTQHAPGAQALSAGRAEQFERAIASADQLSHSDLVARWQLRGRAAFQTSSANVRAFMTSSHGPSEAAALSAALRRLNNIPVSVQVAQSAPERLDTLLELALSLAAREPEKAFEAAQKAVEMAANNPLCLAALALAAEKAGMFAEAFQSIENALQIWDDEPEWHAWAARLAGAAGPYGAEIQHWREAVRLDPQQPAYSLALAHAYLDQQSPLMAVETLNKPHLVQTQDVEIMLALAEAYYHAGSLDEALSYAERAIALEADSPRSLLLCGEIALAMNRADLAEEYAGVALQRDPKCSDVVLFVSKVFKQQGRWNESLNLLERSLPGQASPAPLLLERARLVQRIKGSREAMPLIEDILRQEPENIAALALRAHAQADNGDMGGAEATIHTGLRLEPNQPDLNLLMGRLQHRAGQLDQAIHYLSEAIRQDPSAIEAYIELAKTHQERREDLQALLVYQQAVLVAPEDARPYYAAALILRESKDYLGAEAMLRKAARLSPDDLSIRRQLGAIIALNLVHNTQEAKSTL